MGTSRVNVTISGPVFDGTAARLADEWVKSTQQQIALQGAAIIKSKAAKMNRSGRGGTGAAANAVMLVSGPGGPVISGGIHKGRYAWPWLEGTSKRNQSTGFKGYHVFRLAKGIMAKTWRKVAQEQLDAYIGGMGGAE